MLKTANGLALIALALLGCASAGHVPDPRPACIRLVIRNDTWDQANVFAGGTTSSRRRIATVTPLNHEAVWLYAHDLEADGRFVAVVHQLAGQDLTFSPVPVTCHDGTLHLDVARLSSVSSLYVAAR